MGSSCVLLCIYMYIQWIHINNNATETTVFTFKNSLRLECKYLISLFFFLHSDPPFPYTYFVLFQILGPFFFISWWSYWWWWCLCVCVCIHKYISWASLVCIVLFILHNVFRSGHLDFYTQLGCCSWEGISPACNIP